MSTTDSHQWRSTTVLAVRRNGIVSIGADGQVSLGPTILKATARKVRKICEDSVIVGFAGATADAMTLLQRLEEKIRSHRGALERAAIDVAKDWRTDKYLRNLEAMIIAADRTTTLLITGSGDVISPDDHIVAIGSGGPYALSAGRALLNETDLQAESIVQKSLAIAADICVYTNHELTIETLS